MTEAATTFAYNRLVDIARAIDAYDWRRCDNPAPLGEFLAEIRAHAQAGATAIRAAADAEDQAAALDHEAAAEPPSRADDF